jgi:protein-S-isoprenylcysteine O-methyltransferase Ste14
MGEKFMASLVAVLYGIVAYGVTLVALLYLIGFTGNLVVPKSIDSGAIGPVLPSIVIDVLLIGVFAIQHSVMARRWFKERWTRIVSPVIERSTYVLLASVALALMFWQWRPLGGVVWTVHDPVGRAVLYALFASGFALVLISTFLINHFDLFGLRQVWLYLRSKPYTKVKLGTPALYRVIRHPLYAGFLMAFWAAPVMTYAHLLFAIATTAYILLAIQFEERDLIHEYGAWYEEYRRKVPMIVPFTLMRRRLQRIGTAAFFIFLIKGIVWLAVAAAIVRR